ncbi:Arm DNA-binding domain-containing protein [Dickeya fangzhongdai]|uniref:Arm DNA-binding domain-containing protein n=1 Tax=Dickeya fangzhongdai TaxID=1778540 RepID=UPI0038730581
MQVNSTPDCCCQSVLPGTRIQLRLVIRSDGHGAFSYSYPSGKSNRQSLYNDDNGLSLSVSPNGGKSWYFRFYYWQGKQKRLSLGT